MPPQSPLVPQMVPQQMEPGLQQQVPQQMDFENITPQDFMSMLSMLSPQAQNGQAAGSEHRGVGQKIKDFFKNTATGAKDLFGGTPGQFGLYSPFLPYQQFGILSALQQALQGLQDPSAGFEPIAQQARTEFQQQTIPSIAERFSALGGGQRSSAFGQTLGSAGANLENMLAAQQSQYGLQRGNQLQQLLGLGLTPSFESFYRPGDPGLIRSVAPAAAKAAVTALTAL